jgi:hypothetical protein
MVGFRIEESKNRIPKYKGAAFGVIRWLRLFLRSNNFTRTPAIIVPFTKSLQNFLRFFCEKVPGWLMRGSINGSSRWLPNRENFSQGVNKQPFSLATY